MGRRAGLRIHRSQFGSDFEFVDRLCADARNGASRLSVEDRGYPTACWVWTGAKAGPYASIKREGVWIVVHRMVYERIFGRILGDLTVDHVCRVKLCMNPNHMDAVTRRENVQRAAAQDGKRVCPHGPETRKHLGGKCVPCHKEYDAKRWRERVAA